MKLSIKRIDTTLPLPAYQTKGSAAFDLYARENITVKSWTPTIIPSNIIIKVPKGYFLMIASRSSLQLKKNLLIANGIGTIDQDYHGDTDEIGIIVLNYTNKPIIVERGERIAQALLVKIAVAEKFIEKKTMAKKSRGGFGSTGK